MAPFVASTLAALSLAVSLPKHHNPSEIIAWNLEVRVPPTKGFLPIRDDFCVSRVFSLEIIDLCHGPCLVEYSKAEKRVNRRFDFVEVMTPTLWFRDIGLDGTVDHILKFDPIEGLWRDVPKDDPEYNNYQRIAKSLFGRLANLP